MMWSFWDQSLFVFRNYIRTVKYFLPLRSFLSWSLSQSVSFPSLFSLPLSVSLWFSRSFSLYSLFLGVCVGSYTLSVPGGEQLSLRVSVFYAPCSHVLFLMAVLSQGLSLAYSLTWCAPRQCFSSFAFICACLCVSHSLSISLPLLEFSLSPLLYSPPRVFSSQ